MLKSLTIKNFKCFENQSISVRNLTLLSGLNGMGKSTVLQALLLLRQSYEQLLLRDKGLALNGDYVHIGTAKDALFEKAQEEIIGFGLEFRSGSKGFWHFAYDSETDVMRLTSQPVQNVIFEENLFRLGFQYLQAERIGPRATFPLSDHEVRWLRSIGKFGEFATHYLALFGAKPMPNPELRHASADSIKLRDQVEAWLGEISPGTRLHATSHSTLEAANLEFSFVAGHEATERFRSTNVGFGLTYVLPVIVAILSATKGTLLLMENPEAHLHPRGQMQIGRLLCMAANAGIQTIVETHSDHVLNGVRLAVHRKEIIPESVQLHYFQRNTGNTLACKVISPELLEHGRLSFWPEGFFDEFDKALAELVM